MSQEKLDSVTTPEQLEEDNNETTNNQSNDDYIYWIDAQTFSKKGAEAIIMTKIEELSYNGHTKVNVHEKATPSGFRGGQGGGFKQLTDIDDVLQLAFTYSRLDDESIDIAVLDEEVQMEFHTRGFNITMSIQKPEHLNDGHRKQLAETIQSEFKQVNKVEEVKIDANPYARFVDNVDYTKVRFTVEMSSWEKYNGHEISYHLNKVINPIRGVLSNWKPLFTDSSYETPRKRQGRYCDDVYKSNTIIVDIEF